MPSHSFRNSLLLIVALGLTTSCHCLAENLHKIQKLTFCSEGNPESIAPSVSTSATSTDVYIALYDTLIMHTRGETKLAPSLAEHWIVSRDGKEYTFFLQRGVKWHRNALFQPSRTFNADDVIFTIERQWKKNHPYHHVTNATHEYFNAVGLGSLLKSVQKVDPYTVKFTLNEANAAFLSMLTLSFTSIQNSEYAQAMLQQGTPELIDSNPIGTGPFTFVSYEKDKKLVFKAFPDYWRGRSKLDELEFLITPSASRRWENIQNNTCQVMPFPSPKDIDAINRDSHLVLLKQPGLNVGYLAYNTLKPPFNDVRVRKALNMAINKKAILERVYQNTGIAAINPIPPTMWSYNIDTPDDVFDPEAAKQLLQEAGWGNGFTTDLWAMSVARAYNPNPQLMAQMIQSDLAAIGVNVNIQSPDWSEYAKRMAQGEHAMGLLGWTTGQGDPDAFFYSLLSCEVAKSGGPNVAKFCYKPYDDLIMRARAITNPKLRIPLYEEAQRIFKEQSPWFTIAHTQQHIVIRREVLNFRLSPFGRHDFYAVELENQP